MLPVGNVVQNGVLLQRFFDNAIRRHVNEACLRSTKRRMRQGQAMWSISTAPAHQSSFNAFTGFDIDARNVLDTIVATARTTINKAGTTNKSNVRSILKA